MSEQLSKFAIGDLATTMQSTYTSNHKITGTPALIVKTHYDRLAALFGSGWRYTALVEGKVYILRESELQ